MMINNLSLSELAALHQQIRPNLKGRAFVGEVEARIVNADGGVDQVVKQKNMSTGWLNISWGFNDRNDTVMEVFVASDDGWPMHPWKSVIPGCHSSDSDLGDTRALDSANLIWTFQTTFGAPAVDRVFRYVGLKYQSAASGAGVAPYWHQMHPNVIAATRLTANLTQTTSQTLEITYRLAWQRA